MLRLLRGRSARFAPKFSYSTVPKQGPITVNVNLEPKRRENEDTEVKRARLFYQSRKRGILETCLILSNFTKEHIPTMTRSELDQLERLMDCNDWDLYYWATETEGAVLPCPEDIEKLPVMQKLRKAIAQRPHDNVMQMPDL